MGNCQDKQYIAHQETVNNQLREDISRALDAVRQFQNALHQTPQSKEELEAHRTLVSQQRELAELKELAAVRSELDSLKSTLNMDPHMVLADVKEEIQRIKEKVEAMKGVKEVDAATSTVPPFVSLISSNAGWGGEMSAGFEVTADGVKVSKAGLYQVFATFHPFGFNSHAICAIFHNGAEKVKQFQTDGGPTILYYLAKLEENDVILPHFQPGQMNIQIKINIPGGLHNTIKLHMVKLN